MRILLTTLGSHGDIHPFIALAMELTRRGHQAVLATNPAFRAQSERAGVMFEDMTEHADLKDILTNYGVMDHRRGAKVVLKELTLPMTPAIHARTKELIAAHKPDVLLNHPICLGAPWAAEQAGVPIVTVALAPISWMRSHDPIVFGPWRSHNPRLYATRFDAWAGKWIMRFMLDGALNKMRRERGLAPIKDHLIGEFVRPGLNLGMWAPAFRGPARGDPEGSTICGWAWFDAHHDHEHDLDELHEFVADGPPPIVFTLGSAAVHAPGDFYREAVRAAQMLGRRAALLLGREEYVQAFGALPKGIKAFTYAPFSWLLPRGAATVHHGGIGSTGQALRAATPSVVVPMAHDQFDNAARCKRLGVSEIVHHRHATGERLARALARVLDDPGVALRAKTLGRDIGVCDGATRAIDALESWARHGGATRGAGSGCSA